MMEPARSASVGAGEASTSPAPGRTSQMPPRLSLRQAAMRVDGVVKMKQLHMARIKSKGSKSSGSSSPSGSESSRSSSGRGSARRRGSDASLNGSGSRNAVGGAGDTLEVVKPAMPIPPTPRSTLALIRDTVRDAAEGAPPEQQQEEARKVYRETIDPYLKDKPRSKFTWVVWLALPVVTFISLLMMLMCLGVDTLTSGWQSRAPSGELRPFPKHWRYDIESFVWTLINPVPNHSRNLSHAIIPSQMFLFGMLISFIGIVLQSAASRTTTHVNSFVLNDFFIVGVLGVVLILNSFDLEVVMGIGSPIPGSVPLSASSALSQALSSASSLAPVCFGNVTCPLPSSSSLMDGLASSSSSLNATASSAVSLTTPGIATYPRIGLILGVLGVSMTTVLFLPFVLHMMQVLESEEIITKLMTHGLNALVNSINQNDQPTELHERMQHKANNSIKYLMETAESAMGDNNSNLCSEALDAMCSYAMNYISIKNHAPDIWFAVPHWMRLSSDFKFLNEEAIQLIKERRTWFEWKVLRQYQVVYSESLVAERRELCYHACINTRIIGETAGALNDVHAVDMTLKFFNTYLRASINANDVRTVYNTQFQYRQMAERFVDRERGATKELALRAWKTAKFMLYYAAACQQKRLFFLVETVAQDLRVLCQVALSSALPPKTGNRHMGGVGFDPQRAIFREVHDKLLQVLLNLADISEGSGSKRGVSRALAILVAFYASEGQIGQVKKVQKWFTKETPEFLVSIREELLANSVKEFWEVSERGENFSYLDPALHKPLCDFFEAIFTEKGFADGSTAVASTFWQTKEGKQLKIDQELTNFRVGSDDEGGEILGESEGDESDGDEDDDDPTSDDLADLADDSRASPSPFLDVPRDTPSPKIFPLSKRNRQVGDSDSVATSVPSPSSLTLPLRK